MPAIDCSSIAKTVPPSLATTQFCVELPFTVADWLGCIPPDEVAL
jgi:hypothetical protein